jgi:predicted nucleic acid-binding protein
VKIVVDSNIVFSALLNTKSKIGQLLINGSQYFDFYTVKLLRSEIIRHRKKILTITGFTQKQFDETFHIIVSRIKFIDDILISEIDLKESVEIVSDIDINDSMFIALNNHLSSHFWTGDKKLLKGLKKKGYSKILNSDELFEIFIEKQAKTGKTRK